MLTEEKRCVECANCRYKETIKETLQMYLCGKHRTVITDLTRPSWILGCKGKDFQRRGNE